MKTLRLSLLAGSAAAFATFAGAADIFVPSGTADLQTAITGATAGDRIIIDGNISIEDVVVDKNLIIEAATATTPTITILEDSSMGGEEPAIEIAAGVDATITGLTFDGSANLTLTPPGPYGVDTISLAGGNTVVIEDCTFNQTAAAAIVAKGFTGAVDLTVRGCTFDFAIAEAILIDSDDGNTGNVFLAENNSITDCGDDYIRVKGDSISFTSIDILGNTIFGNTQDFGSEGIQVGADAGTATVLIKNNTIYDFFGQMMPMAESGDAVQLDGPGYTYTIEYNTFFNVGTGINHDMTGQTGSVTIQYNVIAGWNQDGNFGPDDLDKGWGISNNNSLPNISGSYNVVYDAENTMFYNNYTPGTGDVTGSNVASIFVSTNPLDGTFLDIASTGPAFEIDGSNSAGAFGEATLSVENWMMY